MAIITVVGQAAVEGLSDTNPARRGVARLEHFDFGIAPISQGRAAQKSPGAHRVVFPSAEHLALSPPSCDAIGPKDRGLSNCALHF